jgi:hypothetical protein
MKVRIVEVGLNNNFTPAGYVDDEDNTEKRAVIDSPKIYTEKKRNPKKIKIKINPGGGGLCV